MKKQIIVAIITMLFSNFIYGQGNQSIISKMKISTSGYLTFQTSKEVNVKYFILHGSQNMNEDFEVIETISSKGNSMIPQQYRHNLKSIRYNYYYLTQVTMDGASISSKVFLSKKAIIIPEDFEQSNKVAFKAP
ncbi:MAG TPA: hypothetical protein PLQ78_02250 [Flavipsychrobacter sp.]|jgi:hypothetical protein|nr:hypothetical protein [Flavipsychrobacter sp.]